MKMLCTLVILALAQGTLTYDQNKELSYPFVAPPERREVIIRNFDKVELGSTMSEVRKVLGEPDEVLPLFDSKKDIKPIGYTHWYILQRLCGNCSEIERQEKVVRISTNMENVVIAVDHWGF